ncbi:MAG: DUF2877 domain-containing protein [Nocardioidaceae bacterium]|nr:DUF2877 domain-containing protein [Nocardioidaceae bacterium]
MLDALSADARLLDAPPGPLRVHSAFERSANLLTGDGRLVAVTARTFDDAPWSIRADLERFPTLTAGATGCLDADRLRLPGLTLRVSGARPWRPAPLAPFTGAGRLGALVEELGRRGGALPSPGEKGPVEQAVADRLAEGIAALRQDLDLAVRLLAGTGTGLTPAGDDVLAGFGLAAAIPASPVHPMRDRLAAAYRDLRGRTALLSLVTMNEAVQGRARQRILDVADALPFPGRLEAAVARAVEIGHTSGTDLLCGLVAGLG